MILGLDQPFWLSLSYIGTAVFAATGALAAARKQMDLLGAVGLAVVTSIGGGTLRDLLIGQRGVFWIHEPIYIWISALTGFLVFLGQPLLQWRRNLLLFPDAIGLALFTWIGCEKVRLLGLPNTAILIMGVFTGTAGGLIRDVVSNEVPSIFVPGELYATASIVGAFVFLAAKQAGVTQATSALLCITAALAIRLAAIRWKLVLPSAHETWEAFRKRLPHLQKENHARDSKVP